MIDIINPTWWLAGIGLLFLLTAIFTDWWES